jgi:Xaa-Pro aminopeptidase
VAILGLAEVVLPRGGEPILYCLDEHHCRARMPWMNPDDIYPRAMIKTEGGTLKWAEQLKAKLGNLLEGKIGVDLLTKGLADWLPKAFPKAKFVDGKAILEKAKMVKTRDEIECQKTATMITEAGFQALIENLKPGVKECELLAIAWQRFTQLGRCFGKYE